MALPFRYGYKHLEQRTARRGDMNAFSVDTKQVQVHQQLSPVVKGVAVVDFGIAPCQFDINGFQVSARSTSRLVFTYEPQCPDLCAPDYCSARIPEAAGR